VETLRQVVEQEPKHPTTFNEGIDRDLANICLKCMEKEPQRRYTSAAELAEDLERWLREEPIQARPIRTAERLWRWCRRNPKVAALGGAVALLLLLLTLGSTIAAIVFAAQREVVRRSVTQGLVEVNDGRRASYEIPSAMRRALTAGILHTIWRAVFGKNIAVTSASSIEFYFVEHLYEHSTNMLVSLAPILNDLEDSLSERMHTTVEIHMRLLRTPDATYEAMQSTNAIFGRMGPASFAYLDSRSNGVRLLAMQEHKKPLTMAIFSRTNSPVARLAASSPAILLSVLLSNRSLALSHSNSTTGNYLAKRYLAGRGIYATNLSYYAYQGSQRFVRDAVLAGRCDVGAGNLDLVDNSPAFEVLARFEVPNLGRCWVAGRGCDGEIAKHLSACLLEQRDPDILGLLESEVSGFKLLSEEAMRRLREYMRGAEAFDAVK
jgi:ABC-type phosphate/phosphonate transport system substrate-binding protein